jgi:hypothetical protein
MTHQEALDFDRSREGRQVSDRKGVDPLAVGVELRLARLGREDALTKAMRYLLSGRVIVRFVGPQGVRAHVRGSGELWRVQYERGRGRATVRPAASVVTCSPFNR